MEEEFRKIKDPEVEKWLNDHIILNKQFVDEARALKIKPLTNEFWVYHQHRSYEKFGKFGFCVAGIPQMAEDCGLTDKQVLSAYRQLMDKGAVQHIWCDSKVYRNKTKVYVSQALINERKIALTEKTLARTKRQKLTEKDEPIQLDQSGKSDYQSGKSDYQSGKSDLNNYNKQLEKRENSDSGKPSSDPSPFFSPVCNNEKVVSRQADNKKEFALCAELLALMGLSNIKAGVKLRNSVRARLRDGYSELDLRAIARWSATQQDEFYKVPHSLFSEAGVAGAMSLMKKAKSGTTYSTR